MGTDEHFNYVLPVEEFDLNLLSPNARRIGSDKFWQAVSDVIQRDFENFGGSVKIVVDAKTVQVSWQRDPQAPKPLDIVVKKLEQGQHAEAIRLLKHLHQLDPKNASVLRVLGMALSDLGEFVGAEKYLRLAVGYAPADVDALVALGVALARQKRPQQAIEVLRQAIALDDKNVWANRNLGACLLQAGDAADAEKHLQKAVDLAPGDQQSVFGLAQTLEANGKLPEADRLYLKTIELDSRSPVAEVARKARTSLAQLAFRQRAATSVRPDAVMYLLGAIKLFENMEVAEVQKITFEIALLGQNGLDTNDSEAKYRLKSLPGEFSGLHLLSIMHVGFGILAPGQPIGFDLTKEFAAAKQMYQIEKNGGG